MLKRSISMAMVLLMLLSISAFAETYNPHEWEDYEHTHEITTPTQITTPAEPQVIDQTLNQLNSVPGVSDKKSENNKTVLDIGETFSSHYTNKDALGEVDDQLTNIEDNFKKQMDAIKAAGGENEQALLDRNLEELQKNLANIAKNLWMLSSNQSLKRQVETQIAETISVATQIYGSKDLPKENIQEEDGVVKAELNLESIENQLKEQNAKIDQMLNAMPENTRETLEAQVKRNLQVNIPKSEESKEAEVKFGENIQKLLKDKKIDRVSVNTGDVQFGILKDTLKEQKEYLLESKKQIEELENLPEGREIVKNMPVLDLTIKDEGESVGTLNAPVRMEIPLAQLFDETPTKEAIESNYTVYILTDNGWEPVGGVYDEVTGNIVFYRLHLSKYTVLKTQKAITVANSNIATELNTLLGKGIIKEEVATTPKETLNRGEFASWIAKSYGLEINDYDFAYKDLEDNPYKNEILAVLGQDLMVAKDEDNFGVDEPMTSKEMAMVLSLALEKYTGSTTTAEESASLVANSLSDADKNSVSAAVKAGFVDKEFDPTEILTRESGVQTIYKLYK